MVNIEGLNKAEVLAALFNNSKIQGFNVQMVKLGLMGYPPDITPEEAQKILDENERKYFDYLNGKVMKIVFHQILNLMKNNMIEIMVRDMLKIV